MSETEGRVAEPGEAETQTDALRASILAMVDDHKRVFGQADSTIGREALQDSMFIARLRAGENCTIHKLRSLEQWLVSRRPAVALHSPNKGPPPNPLYAPRERRRGVSARAEAV